ncbi:hypothetical protein B566_EDAN004253 [Ephemera danica]|nr:hypothetical protein B566_EDAN004253 [Ephemera danica]
MTLKAELDYGWREREREYNCMNRNLFFVRTNTILITTRNLPRMYVQDANLHSIVYHSASADWKMWLENPQSVNSCGVTSQRGSHPVCLNKHGLILEEKKKKLGGKGGEQCDIAVGDEVERQRRF